MLGDQLSAANPALEGAGKILLIESDAHFEAEGLHRQKAHLVLSAMRHFAAEQSSSGIEVEVRRAATLREGIVAARRENPGSKIRVLEPTGRRLRAAIERMEGVTVLPGTLFLTSHEEFSSWADGRRRFVMEDFYRWQRRRLVVLMDEAGPAGGAWNFDRENRRPPKKGLRAPAAWRPSESEVDAGVRADLSARDLESFGRDGPRLWPATAAEAKEALSHFIAHRLESFGPFQDAMFSGERLLWHSGLSAALNLGLLAPREVVDAAEAAYRRGDAPIASVEGFVRQVVGWREYVHGLYRLRESEWEDMNELGAHAPLPAALWGAPTQMRCLEEIVDGLAQTGYTHHIERLMVLGNLMLLLGVDPTEAVRWFHRTHVDGHDWVMQPNVRGMALFADGGAMMTKPYAATGAYVKRMSDHCSSCIYDPTLRGGPGACPFTSLYWDFLARHRERFISNPRLALSIGNLDRLQAEELASARARANELRRDFRA